MMEYENLINDNVYSLEICMDSVTRRCGKNICTAHNFVSWHKEADNVYAECREEAFDCTAQQGENRVLCTYCIYSPVPAVKSCLLCEASLCAIHLEGHSKSAEHVLTVPINLLEKSGNIKCPSHKEILKYYCFDDAACICVSCCLAGQHKGHQIELLEDAFKQKKRDLKNAVEKLISKEKETERRVGSLQKQRANVQEKTSDISERVTDLFRDIRRQLDDLENRVKGEISRQEEQVSHPLSLLINQLELQRDELSRSIKQIEQLCNLSDPLAALTTLGKITNFWDVKDRNSMIYNLEDLDDGLISTTLQRSLDEIMASVKKVQGSSDILLDVDTAANDVYLSGDRKTVSWSKINQCRLKTINRFKAYQVLSTRSFSSGQHYWEVETSESGKWMVGMCYPSVARKGEQSFIGNNNKSWGLCWIDKKYKMVHDQKEKKNLNFLPCHKIGIYLDYEAGRLSFYELCDPIRHLHTFTATFTEPLHAVFWVWYGWVRIKS